MPLGSLRDVQRINGLDTVGHYNVYPAALIQGAILPGGSSGQAIEKMERICRENLSSQFSFEWSQLTYQDDAAQYDSWSLPLAVILIASMCLLSAMTAIYFEDSLSDHEDFCSDAQDEAAKLYLASSTESRAG